MKLLSKNFKFSRDPRFTPAGLTPDRLTEIEEIAMELVEIGAARNGSGWYEGEGDEMAGDGYVCFYKSYPDMKLYEDYDRKGGFVRNIGINWLDDPDGKYLKTCCNYLMAVRKVGRRPAVSGRSARFGYDYNTF